MWSRAGGIDPGGHQGVPGVQTNCIHTQGASARWKGPLRDVVRTRFDMPLILQANLLWRVLFGAGFWIQLGNTASHGKAAAGRISVIARMSLWRSPQSRSLHPQLGWGGLLALLFCRAGFGVIVGGLSCSPQMKNRK